MSLTLNYAIDVLIGYVREIEVDRKTTFRDIRKKIYKDEILLFFGRWEPVPFVLRLYKVSH